jgi:hypothetical protein
MSQDRHIILFITHVIISIHTHTHATTKREGKKNIDHHETSQLLCYSGTLLGEHPIDIKVMVY